MICGNYSLNGGNGIHVWHKRSGRRSVLPFSLVGNSVCDAVMKREMRQRIERCGSCVPMGMNRNPQRERYSPSRGFLPILGSYLKTLCCQCRMEVPPRWRTSGTDLGQGAPIGRGGPMRLQSLTTRDNDIGTIRLGVSTYSRRSFINGFRCRSARVILLIGPLLPLRDSVLLPEPLPSHIAWHLSAASTSKSSWCSHQSNARI